MTHRAEPGACGYPIADDRGRPVRATAPAWGPGRRHSDELTRARSREIERKFSRSGAPIRRATIAATLLALPFFALPALAVPWLVPLAIRHGLQVLMIPTAAVLGIVGPVVMFTLLRRLLLPRLVRAYVNEGFCGSCGYPLDSVRPDSDGCSVCPECGGAWRRE